LKSKIHCATVTHSNINYIGSLTIDEILMEAADILPYEKVEVWNLNNGARVDTYAIVGEKNSGIICANGAAARLIQPGDKIIIATFGEFEDEEIKNFKPKIIFVDEKNKIKI
jgi:aspartate 1-decarboxylase